MSITLPTLNLSEAEKALCQQAIATSPTLADAATVLGLTRHALRRRISKYKLTDTARITPVVAQAPMADSDYDMTGRPGLHT